VDLVRFSNSGSEVVGTAVRLARAQTGRRLIIRFEGHYHGWQDTVYWSNHVDPSLAKDYLFAWLTGELATDPSTASGYGCYELEAGRWDATVLAMAGLAVADLAPEGGGPGLPTVRPSATCRPLRPDAAARLGCAPVPVVLGAADSVLGALGLGVRAPGEVAYLAGTSTVILGVTDRLVLDPAHRFLVTPLAEPGWWGVEMDLLATGSAITWLASLLGDGLTAAGLVELAAGIDPSRAPVLLPYLSPGEQGALWATHESARRRLHPSGRLPGGLP
jgi:xylulokinase